MMEDMNIQHSDDEPRLTTVLCYGDSNTYGYNPSNGLRYGRNVRWPCRLQQLLGEEYHVIEEGCNGRTLKSRYPLAAWKCGLDYLRPCLNSHKPVDIVIMMLGSNDLKEMFHLTAKDIASHAGELVDVIKEFTLEKQGFEPKIILVSPPKIGEGIAKSPFRIEFSEDALTQSELFSKYFARMAKEKGCIFFDAALYTEASAHDSLHLTPESHEALAGALCEEVKKISACGA